MHFPAAWLLSLNRHAPWHPSTPAVHAHLRSNNTSALLLSVLREMQMRRPKAGAAGHICRWSPWPPRLALRWCQTR